MATKRGREGTGKAPRPTKEQPGVDLNFRVAFCGRVEESGERKERKGEGGEEKTERRVAREVAGERRGQSNVHSKKRQFLRLGR